MRDHVLHHTASACGLSPNRYLVFVSAEEMDLTSPSITGKAGPDENDRSLQIAVSTSTLPAGQLQERNRHQLWETRIDD